MRLAAFPKATFALFSVLALGTSASNLKSDERELTIIERLENLENKQAEREMALKREIEAHKQENEDLRKQLDERQLFLGIPKLKKEIDDLRNIINNNIAPCVGYAAASDTCNIGGRTGLNMAAQNDVTVDAGDDLALLAGNVNQGDGNPFDGIFMETMNGGDIIGHAQGTGVMNARVGFSSAGNIRLVTQGDLIGREGCTSAFPPLMGCSGDLIP